MPPTANLGWTHVLARDCDRAVAELKRVLTYDAENGMALFYLGYAYTEAGRFTEAIEALERARTATGGMPWLAELLAWAQAAAGRRDLLEAALADAERRSSAATCRRRRSCFFTSGSVTTRARSAGWNEGWRSAMR